MCRLNCGQGAAREPGAPDWQQNRHQCITGEGMAEADLPGLVDEQPLPDTCPECLRDDVCGVTGSRIQQCPVHAAAQQRGSDEHVHVR